MLQSFVEALNKMKTLICFGGYDISYVLSECFNTSDFISVEFVLDNNENISTVWDEFVRAIPAYKGLTKSDKDVLCGFGKSLGITDTQGQINNCELYRNLIEECLHNSRSDELTKCRLYRVLGFSLGFAVTLMIL